MFNFKTTIHKLGDYLYFFIPIMISEIFKKGEYIRVKFKNLPAFEKQLTIPRRCPKQLFMIIIPKSFTEKNKIKHNEEYEVKIELCQKNK